MPAFGAKAGRLLSIAVLLVCVACHPRVVGWGRIAKPDAVSATNCGRTTSACGGHDAQHAIQKPSKPTNVVMASSWIHRFGPAAVHAASAAKEVPDDLHGRVVPCAASRPVLIIEDDVRFCDILVKHLV